MTRRGYGLSTLTALAVALTTAVAVSHGILAGRLPTAGVAALVGFYLAVAGIIIAFAVWTANDLGLPTFLLARPLSGRERLARLLLHGVATGLVLSLASVALAGSVEGGVLRPWFWRQIQTPGGVVLLSANAALLEESFFRLFLIPFIVSIAARMQPQRLSVRVQDGRARMTHTRPEPSKWIVFAAVLVSSVLFGLAHVFNPIAAMLLGPFLAHSYLRGGWESAVLAHFVADLVVLGLYF